MELREYIAIFRKQEKVFWTIVFLSLFVAVVWQKGQPVKYEATLLLNIGRTGIQNTQDYTYDNFYRLQADERFADTIVRWLGSPRVVEDIYESAGLDATDTNARHAFGAKRFSSQMIEVTYTGGNDMALKKIAEAVVTTLNRYTNSLNKENKETDWFIVIGSDPVVRDARVSLSLAVTVGIMFGIFVGFWMALLKHYLQSTKTANK